MKDTYDYEIISSHISKITYKELSTRSRKSTSSGKRKYDLKISDSIDVLPGKEQHINMIVERHVFLSPKDLFDIHVKGVVSIEVTGDAKHDISEQSRIEYVEKNKEKILQQADMLELISLTVSQIIMVSKNPLFITPPVCVGIEES